ncbi:hypothetical protein [Rhizorhabdus histidinilytica]|uniref:hypothetical protein n=1 Tax=Rhizorhabdus histidinilytica TaxID=439228 RepID=UPI0032209D5A
MQGPIGYPPPTLVRKRSGLRARLAVVLATIALAAGGYGLTRLIQSREASAPTGDSRRDVAPEAVTASADTPAAAMPDSAATVVVEAPTDAAPADQPVDARRANAWYYVARLGDGPGAIYSRTGGQWSYAFACTSATRTIEIIAIGTGSPGSFDQQAITVGKVKLMMDASYSPDGGGTISTTLPAGHAFFDALDGSVPMTIQLHATRKAVVPIGPAVVRLIRDCRGRR